MLVYSLRGQAISDDRRNSHSVPPETLKMVEQVNKQHEEAVADYKRK